MFFQSIPRGLPGQAAQVLRRIDQRFHDMPVEVERAYNAAFRRRGVRAGWNATHRGPTPAEIADMERRVALNRAALYELERRDLQAKAKNSRPLTKGPIDPKTFVIHLPIRIDY